MKCTLIQEHQNSSNWCFDKNAKDFSGTGFSAFFWRRIPHWIYWKGVGNLNFCISVNFYLSLYLLSRKHSRLSGLSRLHQYRHIGRTPELNKVSQLQCHWGDENDDDRLQDWEYQTYYISKRCDLNSAGVEVMIFKPSSKIISALLSIFQLPQKRSWMAWAAGGWSLEWSPKDSNLEVSSGKSVS